MIPLVEVFVCCGGRRFVYVPFIGLLEQVFAAGFVGLAALLLYLLWLAKKYPKSAATVLAVGAVVGKYAFDAAKAASDNEGGVKGWLEALDMARVDTQSDALMMWLSDQDRLLRDRKQSPPGFDLLKFEQPWRARVLSTEESAEATAIILGDRDHWIHMDRRCGPLPSFIYGVYYQYNSHGRKFPTPDEMRRGREQWEASGEDMEPFQGQRATSTLYYSDRHGVQAYNARQQQTLGTSLQLHERLREALANATGMEVVYHPNWGLPGAQITFSHRVMEFNVFQAHIDGSYAPITNEFRGAGAEGCVPNHRLSVTLALQMPSSGGGLDLWVFDRSLPGCNTSTVRVANDVVQRRQQRRWQNQNQPFPEVASDRKGEAALSAALACLDMQKEEYVAGEVVIHSGSVIHAVSPWGFKGPAYDEARVTIQGFAFLCAGKWHLHW